MASVRERHGPRGTVYAVLYRHDGRQRSRTFTTRRDADKHAERIERFGPDAADRILDAQAGHDPERVPTVTEQLHRHIDGLSGVQADTITGYRTIASKIAETSIGPMPIDTLTRDDIARWVREQETAGISAKTIRNRQSLLSAALTRAVHEELLTRNPAHKVRISRTERREMTLLTPAEFGKLLEAATPHYRPLLLFLYGTGARLGEATAVRVRDLNLDDTPPTVTIARAWKRGGVVGPPKTAAGRRTITIPEQVAVACRALTEGRHPDDLVFTNMNGTRVLQPSLHDLWQRWITVLRKTPRIHDLRHGHASVMIAAGINLHDLKYRLGHESITTTSDTYGHLMPEAQVQAERAASLALSRAMGTQLPSIGN